MSIPRAGYRVTNFQFTAHTSKTARQDKFMPFSGLVAITDLMLFICYSLRHARLFKRDVLVLLFKAPEVLGYFYGLAFSSQRNWGKASSSTGIPMHFYDVLTTFVQCNHWKTGEDAIVWWRPWRPFSEELLVKMWIYPVTFQQDNFILLCLCLLCLCCLLSFEMNEMDLDAKYCQKNQITVF